MREIAVWFAAGIMFVYGLLYAWKILKKETVPSLATWVMFAVGGTLSLATYFQEEHWDWKSGILNTIDMAVLLLVISSILITRNWVFRFEKFEKKYLRVAMIAVLVWVVTKRGLIPNLILQGLMTWAYIPTFEKLLQKRYSDSESFFAWSVCLTAAIVGLYPAIIGGNFLAVVYALRGILMVSLVLVIIWKNKKLMRMDEWA